MTEARANPLWAFTRTLYDEMDAAEACRSLQAREGLDVNVLLFCAWAGRHGHRLSTGQIERLCAASVPWQAAVTDRLRGARTWLATQDDLPQPVPADDGAGALARAIAAAETESDRIEQHILYQTLPLADGEPDVGAMVNNIHTYFGLLERTPGPEDTADLVAVVLAGLPRQVRALDLVRRFDEAREEGADRAP